MTVSSFAKTVALEIADRMVVENIGATHDDAMAWLTTTDDGRKYLREEVHARVKRGSTKRGGTAKTFNQVLAGDEADADLDDDDVGDGVNILDDDESDVPADLIDRAVEMHGGKLTRAEALEWLLAHPIGREVARSQQQEKNMASIEKLRASRLQKLQDAGPVEIAKSILRGDDENNLGVDEAEFTSLIGTAAQKAHPGLSESQAFAKVFSAQTPDGALLRKARSKILQDATSDSAYPFPR
jgi:hypothetical protein